MSDIRAKIFGAFNSEYKRHLNAIAHFLKEAEIGSEKSPDDYELVIRAAHTLKGAARAVSLSFVERSAAQMELILKKVKTRDLVLEAAAVQRLKEVIASLEIYIESAAVAYTPPEPPGILHILETLIEPADDSQATAAIRMDSDPVPVQKTTARTQRELQRKIFSIFQIEYKEHLEKIRNFLSQFSGLKTPPGDQLLDLLRSAHSLKGASLAVGLDVVQSLAHLLEAIFVPLKDGQEPLTPPAIAIANQLLDAIEDYVSALDHTESPPIPVEVMESIRSYLHISDDGGIPVTKRQDSAPVLGERVWDSAALDSVRINTQFLDRLQKSSGQLMEETAKQRLIVDQILKLQTRLNEMSKDSDLLIRHSGQMIRNFESHPEYAVIARHLYFVKHQTRQLSKGIRNLLHQEKSAFRTNEAFSRRIHKDVQNVRMIPAENVFQGFRKMVRDLAKEEKKQIDFQLKGMDIPVDRMMLQHLKDPVIHVLRNAVSHGIESPEERKKSGKNETAILRMSLSRMDGRLQITISDDGRGLDTARITQAAIERRMIRPDEADQLTAQESQHLIFKQGVSTAKTVTELSGRGMGLSVVKEMADKLQGDIRVSSDPGKSFSISITVHVTIATHRLLLVRCHHQVFGLPLHFIEKVSQIRRNDIQLLEGRPVVACNHRPVRIASLAMILFGSESNVISDQDALPVLFLKSAEQKVAVLVDHLIAEEAFLVKDLPKPLRKNRFFSGGFLLKDGTIGLIINPMSFIGTEYSFDSLVASSDATIETSRNTEPRPFRILIVDDSITTRTLEKAILEAHGYHVTVAVDGMEGLKQLRTSEVDLVITDVDMPRMDGFTLVSEMKQHDQLKNLPVIIVTSMDNPKDRERGLEVGADAYIVKQKFDQQNLLETIRQIL